MKNLLWIGDACCDSGFAEATHQTLLGLDYRYSGKFNCSVLGLNYLGDPHGWAYDIYPTWPGGDHFGLGRLNYVVNKVRPDVIFIQNDPWNVPAYMELLKDLDVPVVGSMAVDGLGCRGGNVNGETAEERGLNAMRLVVFWTEFGAREARLGGYAGPTAVVPLGVDRKVFYPVDRALARRETGLPAGAFLFGNVNRNQIRKRMDLSLMYFCEWWRDYGKPEDAVLMLHSAPTGEAAFDLMRLVDYLDRQTPGFGKHVLLSRPDAYHGLSKETMRFLYNSLDCGISTSQSEGMGLPALEMMACGVPCILPDHSAFSEWAWDAALLVPASGKVVMPTDVMQSVVDKEPFIKALQRMYLEPHLRAQMRQSGLDLVSEPRYDWANIGRAVSDAIEQTLWPAGELASV